MTLNGKLKVENNHVQGQLHAETDEYTVIATVKSYDWISSTGETLTNHAPHVVITDNNGKILTEAEINEQVHPDTAIESARTVAQEYIDNPTDYI